MLATPHGCCPNEKAAEKKEMVCCVPKMSMGDEILEEHGQRRATDYCREPKGVACYCFQIIAEIKKGLYVRPHTHTHTTNT